ncbi:MAG: ribosomal L7Ae/L30e/S12e/Gadd45 family protein [Candidatus Micrarchaeia archaeon]
MPDETPKEIVDKALSAIKLAKQDGSVRKGVNEVTKSLERGLATLVVVANDVSPKEVVMHLPGLCEQHKTPLVYVPAKLDLGKAAGLNVPCSSVAIEKPGSASAVLKEIATWYASSKPGSQASSQSSSASSASAQQAKPAPAHAQAQGKPKAQQSSSDSKQ